MTPQTYTAPDTKKVLVTYYDDSTKETTVGELREYFNHKDEDPKWAENFFKELTQRLVAYGKFAKYEIILD